VLQSPRVSVWLSVTLPSTVVWGHPLATPAFLCLSADRTAARAARVEHIVAGLVLATHRLPVEPGPYPTSRRRMVPLATHHLPCLTLPPP
jgi:hypothetical protein